MRYLKLSASFSAVQRRAWGAAIATRAFHSSSPRAVLYQRANLKTFSETINAKDRVTLVDFFADWCSPCRQLAPILEKQTEEPNTSGSGLPLDLVTIDTETEVGHTLAAKYKVRGLPTIIAFRGGKVINQFAGAQPPKAVKDFINGL